MDWSRLGPTTATATETTSDAIATITTTGPNTGPSTTRLNHKPTTFFIELKNCPPTKIWNWKPHLNDNI